MTDLNCGDRPYVSLRRPSLEVQEDGSVLVRIENDTYRFTNISLGSVVECDPDGKGILIDGVLCPFPDSTEPRYPLIVAPTNPDTPEAREAAWPVIKEGNEWSVVLGWNNIDNASASPEIQGQTYMLGLGNIAHDNAGVNNVLIGYGNEVDGGWNSILIGTQVRAHFNGTINMGFGSETTGANGVAIGGTTKAAQQAVAIGNASEANQRYNVSIGQAAKANGTRSVVVGYSASDTADADAQTAVGIQAATRAVGASAFGAGAGAIAAYTTVLGQGAMTTFAATESVAIGHGAYTDQPNVVSVGSGTRGTGPATRRITSVTDGVDPTDAVTMRQLDALIPAGTEGQVVGYGVGGILEATDPVAGPPGTSVNVQTFNNLEEAQAAAVAFPNDIIVYWSL